MTQPTDLAHKGDQVEEWVDLRFFRPVGLRLAAALRGTPVSADQVTVAGMLLGLVGAVLFYPESAGLNWLGLALLIGSDILDSADGQLARIRGTSSRWGRILDGISDTVRFAVLYLVLAARLLVGGAAPAVAIPLIVAAGLSQSVHAAVADFTRQVFLWLRGDKSELDLPEDLDGSDRSSWLDRLQFAIYRGYVRRQTRCCPVSTDLVRRQRTAATAGLGPRWTGSQHRWIARLGLIGTNIRFPMLAIAILASDPTWFLWLTIIPQNLALAWILIGHERNARRLAAGPAPAPTPQAPEAAR